MKYYLNEPINIIYFYLLKILSFYENNLSMISSFVQFSSLLHFPGDLNVVRPLQFLLDEEFHLKLDKIS